MKTKDNIHKVIFIRGYTLTIILLALIVCFIKRTDAKQNNLLK